MQTAEIEVLDRGEKHDARGRVIQKREERERLLEGYDRSGLTQRAFSKREGIKYSTLVWWLKQRREREGGNNPVRFEQYRVGEAANLGPLEVSLPDGTVVRGSNPAMLSELVKFLRA